MESFVPNVLSVAAATFGASSCSFFEVDEGETIFLRYVFHQGRVITPLELPLLDETKFGTLKRLADGFTVPVEHLGVHATRRDHSVLLDHRTATATPEFHAFALSVGWELELNVPLLVGGKMRGCFLIHRQGDAPFSPADISLAESLGRQLTLALQASRNAAQEREAAIVREQERSARERADELVKANVALRATLAHLASQPDHKAFLGAVLIEASRQLNAHSGHLAIIDEEQAQVVTIAHSSGDQLLPLGEFSEAVPIAQVTALPAMEAAGGPRNFDLNTEQHLFMPGTLEWHKQFGSRTVLTVPMILGKKLVGFLGFAFRGETNLTSEKSELLMALAQQAALATELIRMSQKEQAAVIAREREQAAQERAEVLGKAKNALQATVDATSQLLELDKLVPKVLGIIANVFETENCAIYENLPSGEVRLRYWHAEGRTMLPAELLQLDEARYSLIRNLAAGFFVPPEYLGQDSRMAGTVCLDHTKGTAVPEFDQWAISIGLELELNIGIASQGERCATLCVYRPRGRPFTPREIVLAEALARQIGLALQVTKLSQMNLEAAVAREREQAARRRADELIKTNAALRMSLDRLAGEPQLEDFLEEILRIAAEQAGVPLSHLWMHDEQGRSFLRLGYLEGKVFGRDNHPATPLARFYEKPFSVPLELTGGEPLSERVKPLIVQIREDANMWNMAAPELLRYYESLGIETKINIPLRFGGRCIGALAVYLKDRRGATVELVELVSALGYQAVLAMELTRLADRSREAAVAHERGRAAQQRADELAKANGLLRRVNERLAHETNYRAVLGLLLAEITDLVGNDAAAVFTYDEGAQSLRFLMGFDNGGIVSELVGHPYGHPDRPVDVRLFPPWREMVRSREQQFVQMSTDSAAPPSNEWHRGRGHQLLVQAALVANGEPLGLLGLAFTSGELVDPSKVEFFNAVAQQATLALQLSRQAERAEQAVVSRERAQMAEQRAFDLAKSNQAFQESIDALGLINNVNDFLPTVLGIIGRSFGAISSAYFEHSRNETVFLRYWSFEGRIYNPNDLLNVDPIRFDLVKQLAAGFTVPNDYLGTPVRERSHAVIVDHKAGTSVPVFDAFAVKLGWDCELNVPLVVNGVADGAICIYQSAEVGFTAQQVELAETLAKQLAMALAASRIAERERAFAIAREQEQAAKDRAAELARANATVSRSLAAISQSTDFDDTLEKVFLEIVAAADASAGHLFLYDARANTLATIVWTDEDGHGRGFCPDSPPLLQSAFDADVTPAFRLCLESKEIFGINIKDLTSKQAALMWPGTTEWHLAHGRESACAIPVLVGQRPVGVIGLAWKDQFSFSTEQRELLFALTNQAAMVIQLRELADSQRAAAISHEREQAAHERAGELAKANCILRRVNERLSGETNYRSVLGLLLAELSSVVGNIGGGIFTFDANTYALRFVLGFEDGHIVDELVGHPHGHTDRPADARVFLGWTDLTARPAQEFIKMTPGDATHPSNEWHSARHHRLLVRTPLIANEVPVGTLCLAFGTEGPLDPLKLELCNAVAQQATLALQLARLSDQARQADVARERETTILQERTRFAGQIHDTLAQGFTGTLLHLEALRVRAARGERVSVEELQSVRKIAALGLAEARRSALAIRPLALDGRDLSTALQQLTERSAVPGLLDCRWSLGGIPRPLSPIADEALLNIAHEAVSNAIRHADASNIHITLAFDPDGVSLFVRDDGIGFDASDSRQRGHTFGLRSMRERATTVGGELNVVSKNGEGTTVTVHLPTA